MLRLFCLFNSITSDPLYSFIVMFLFIVFFVPIYYSFCVCFISYIFVCYSFHYKYFCNYPTEKKKNPIPGTRALQVSSRLSIACSQASLRLAFSIAYLICGLAPCCLRSTILFHFAFCFLLRFCHNPRVMLRVT